MSEEKVKATRLEMIIDACHEQLDNLNQTESETDYFLRYTGIVPKGEMPLHEIFSRDCVCRPESDFDEASGWRTIKHKSIKES